MTREIKPYYEAMLKWAWLIVLATVIAGLGGYSTSSQLPRIYQTSTTLLVGQLLQSAQPAAADFNTSQQLAKSYATLARSRQILQATIDALGLDASWEQLARSVQAEAVAGTQLLRVDVVDTNPERGKAIADEVARQLILRSPTYDPERESERQYTAEQIASIRAKIDRAEAQLRDLDQRLATEDSARALQDVQAQMALLQQQISSWQATYARLLAFYEGSRVNFLSVVEPAKVPQAPVSPDVLGNTLAAAGVALLLAVAVALLLERVAGTVRTSEDLETALGVRSLGTVGRLEKIANPVDHLVVLRHPLSPVSESFRYLRTNIRRRLGEVRRSDSEHANASTDGRGGGTLVITSAGPSEGKTITACNLAISLAQAGLRVILVDADMRRPSVHRFFDVPGEDGLTTLLANRALPLKRVLVDTPVPGLSILPSGAPTGHPADLLGTQTMRARLAQMARAADVVILDSPPLLAVADASALSTMSHGVLLVVATGATRPEEAQKAKAMLDEVGAQILGAVLNKSTSKLTFYRRYLRLAKRAEAY